MGQMINSGSTLNVRNDAGYNLDKFYPVVFAVKSYNANILANDFIFCSSI